MSLVKEDWERVHLTDEMYIKEMEYLEQEHYKHGEKPPAKITVKNDTRKSRSSNRTDKEKAKIARRAKRKLKIRKM